jgi:3-oxoacyl-[acyl-carrier protein] reductase
MPPALLASSSHRLAGKRALVTGGTRGIGRAIAERLAAEGAAVAITYSRNRHEAETLAAQITEADGVGFAIEARFEERGSIDALFATLDQRFRDQFGDTALDIVVNSAGIAAPAPIATISEEDYERIFAINTKDAMFVAHAAAARMREGGRIINIGSGAAKQPGAATASMG